MIDVKVLLHQIYNQGFSEGHDRYYVTTHPQQIDEVIERFNNQAALLKEAIEWLDTGSHWSHNTPTCDQCEKDDLVRRIKAALAKEKE